MKTYYLETKAVFLLAIKQVTVAIISTSAHEKLMRQLQSFIDNDNVNMHNGVTGLLSADAGELQRILDNYQATIAQLRALIIEYHVVQQRARKNMRKAQHTNNGVSAKSI